MLQELQKVAEVWIACYLVLKMQKGSSNIAMQCVAGSKVPVAPPPQRPVTTHAARPF